MKVTYIKKIFFSLPWRFKTIDFFFATFFSPSPPNSKKKRTMTSATKKITVDSKLVVSPCNATEEKFGQQVASTGTKDALLSAVLVAYNYHYTLSLIPDDVWLHILMSIAIHVSSTPDLVDFYRAHLANKDNPDGFTTITLILPDELLQRVKRNEATTEELQVVFGRFLAEVGELSRSDLFKTFEADFTTSTPLTLLISRIVTAYATKEYLACTSPPGVASVKWS